MAGEEQPSPKKPHTPVLFKPHLPTLEWNKYFQTMAEKIYQHSITQPARLCVGKD